jgi:hypothetical protein
MMIGSPNSDTINQSIDQWVGKIILGSRPKKVGVIKLVR